MVFHDISARSQKKSHKGNVGILSGGSGGVEKYSTIDEQAGANHLRITSGEAASNE